MKDNYKVVLFNAPPEAGKDVAAKHCAEVFHMEHKEFKGKLYDIVQCLYALTDEQLETLKLRENKEVPNELLGGMSLRQAMINTSENIIKPNFSKSYFGDSLAKSINYDTVVSDSGFIDELMRVVDKVGEDNVLVVRIHRDGYTFDGDSRKYIPDGTVKNIIDIQNYMTPTNNELAYNIFKRRVGNCVSGWLAGDKLCA